MRVDFDPRRGSQSRLFQPSTESSCSALDVAKGNLPLVASQQQCFHQCIGGRLTVDINHGGLKFRALVQQCQPETPKWCLTNCLEVTSDDLLSPSCYKEVSRMRFPACPHHSPTPFKRIDSAPNGLLW